MNEEMQKAIAAGFTGMAEEIAGLSAVVAALIRALEESGALERAKFVAVLDEFKRDMEPNDLGSRQGQVVQRFLVLLGSPAVSPTGMN